VQATEAATVAQRLPFMMCHFEEGFIFPETMLKKRIQGFKDSSDYFLKTC